MTARIERGGAVAIYGTTATRCDLAAETRTHQGLNSTRLGSSPPAALNAGFAPHSRRSDAYGFTSQIDPQRPLAAMDSEGP
jgi:hypothetical protein